MIRFAAYQLALALVTLAVVMTIALAPSCTKNGPGATWTGAFAACAEGDLGKLVGSATPQQTVLEYVSELINDNAPTLEADLTSLAGKIGLAAVECAVTASIDVIKTLLTQQPAGSGSGSAAPAFSPRAVQMQAGMERALRWMDTQLKAKAKGGGK